MTPKERALELLAQRADADAEFLGATLAAFARSQKLNDTTLALHLQCKLEDLPLLKLCRSPRPAASYFASDVGQIARRFELDAEVLAEAVRLGQALMHLRSLKAGRVEHMLRAARDRENPSAEGGAS